MQNQELEKFSMAGSQSVKVKARAEGRARQERGCWAWAVEGSSALDLHYGEARCQLGTQMQSAIKGNFLN